MLLGGVVFDRMWRETPVIEEICGPVFRERLIEPIGEVVDPCGCRVVCRMAAEFGQVVGEAAAANDEHAFAAERCQHLAELQVMVGAQMRLHGQLEHGDVGGRIDQGKRDPGAVVEPALVINVAGKPACRRCDATVSARSGEPGAG